MAAKLIDLLESFLGHLRDAATSRALLRQLRDVVGHVPHHPEENAMARNVTAGVLSRHFPQALEVEIAECENATLELG